MEERRTGKVDGRPEGRGWTGGGGAVTVGDLPRQRGEAPGGAEDAPPQGDRGSARCASPGRVHGGGTLTLTLGWAGLGLAGAQPSGRGNAREFADRKRRDAHGWSPSSKTRTSTAPAAR